MEHFYGLDDGTEGLATLYGNYANSRDALVDLFNAESEARNSGIEAR